MQYQQYLSSGALVLLQNDGNDSNSPLTRASPSPNDTLTKQHQCTTVLSSQVSNESQAKRVSRMQKGDKYYNLIK